MDTRTPQSPPDDLHRLVEDRIQRMESACHAFPRKFSPKDWWLTAAVALSCLAVVIAGAFL